MTYITYDEYKALKGSTLTEENAEKFLTLASHDVDSLTFNRICKIGFDNLTDFQKLNVKTAVALQADFICENEDLLTSAISGYSINGVNVDFGKTGSVKNISGVYIPATTFSILKQTGLCSLVLR